MALSKIRSDSMTDTAIQSNRNLLINGAMEIFQRTSSVSSVSDNTYVVQDRMNFFFSNDGVISVFASSEHPTGAGFSKSLKVDVTTADTSIAAGHYFGINQRIEGYNHAQLEYGTATAKSIVVSFYAKSNLTGPFCYSVKNGASDRSFPIEFSLSAANTWERISFVIPGDTSGTWLETNGIGAYHQISLAMGSTYQGTNNTWQAGNKVATSNQVNLLSSTSNEFFLTGWQVEIGTGAPTAFEHEDIGTTLRKCQRYYVRMNADAAYSMWGAGFIYTTQQAKINIAFPVEMRDVPSLGQSANNTLDLFTGGGTPAFTQDADINNPSTWATNVTVYCGSGLTAGQGAVIMANNSVGAYLEFKAEL